MSDTLIWKKIGPLANIPMRGSRRLCFGLGAVYRPNLAIDEDQVGSDRGFRKHDQHANQHKVHVRASG